MIIIATDGCYYGYEAKTKSNLFPAFPQYYTQLDFDKLLHYCITNIFRKFLA